MTTYKKIDPTLMEVTEMIEDKSRYDVSVIRAKIAELQAELDRLQILETEAVKIGL